MTNETNAALSALREFLTQIVTVPTTEGRDLWIQTVRIRAAQHLDDLASLEASQREAPVAEGEWNSRIAADIARLVPGLGVNSRHKLNKYVRKAIFKAEECGRRLAERPSVTKVNRPGSNSTTSDWDDGGMKIWNHGVLILHLDKDECQKLLSQLPAPSVTNVSREDAYESIRYTELVSDDVASELADVIAKLHRAPAPGKAADEGVTE